MQKTHSLRNRLLVAAFALLFAGAPMPARGASKEIIELQTQVQQLLDMVQRLQSTVDTRMGVVQHLAEQTSDDANRMTAAVTALQQKLAAQSDATVAKMDTASGQMQSLNDSVDELKSRITKLDKTLQDLQTQLQNIQNPPTPTPVPATAPTAQPTSPTVTPTSKREIPGQREEAPSAGASLPAPSQPAAEAAPLAESFQAGVRDYNAGKFEVAAGEFQDVIHSYPLDELAGTAQFYLGEINYRQLKLTEAVKAYNAVLEGFPGNAKAPAAQLRKGLALLQMNRKDAGVHELRLLIQRHPQTPEAAQARTKLNGMGLKATAAR